MEAEEEYLAIVRRVADQTKLNLEFLRDVKEQAIAIREASYRDKAMAEVVRRLMMLGEWQEAQSVVGLISSPLDRVFVHSELVSVMLEARLFGRAKQMLTEIAALAISIPVMNERAKALHRVARVSHLSGEHDLAVSLWKNAIEAAREAEKSLDEKIQDESSWTLSSIAEGLAMAREWRLAREVALAIENEPRRQRTQFALLRIADESDL